MTAAAAHGAAKPHRGVRGSSPRGKTRKWERDPEGSRKHSYRGTRRGEAAPGGTGGRPPG